MSPIDRAFLPVNCAILLAIFMWNTVSASADPPPVLLRRIQQLIDNGDLPDARSQLGLSLKKYPSSAELHNYLGQVEARHGNYLEAESSFQKAIRLDRHLNKAYLNLGQLYQENGDRDKDAIRKGTAVYLDLLKMEPGNTEARLQAAYMTELGGTYQASLDLLGQLPAPLRLRAQALSIRCADEAGLQQGTKAAATAKELLDAPDLTEVNALVAQKALAATGLKQLETTLLEGLVVKRLASSSSLVRLAELYEEAGQLPKARASLEEAATLGPVSAELLFALPRVAYKQQDREGALGYLARARDVDPENPAIHFFAGMVCLEMDRPLEAEKWLRESVRLKPENANYNYALGAVATEGGRWADAIPYFQKYATLKPEDPRGKLTLGTAYFHAHQDGPARRELEGAGRFQETAGEAHLYLGKLALRENDLPKAEIELKSSLEQNAGNVEAQAELGFLYAQQERYADAEKALHRSLELDPDGVRANKVLLALYQKTGDQRAEAQAKRVEHAGKKREGTAKALARGIDLQPY